MSNIAKRPDGRWRARYRDSAGREHAKHFDRKVDAQRWLDAVTAAVQTGTYVDPARAKITIGQLADQWLAGKVNLKPTTRAVYTSALNVQVLPRWKTVPLSTVEHGAIQQWIADLNAKGVSPGHIRKSYVILSGILAMAVRDRRIPSNPADALSLPRIRHRRRRYLTAEQVEALAIAAGRGRLVILVLAYCGLRWSELAGLRAGRIDLDRRRMEIAEAMTEVNGSELIFGTPKSHERRAVPLPRFLVEELRPAVVGLGRDDLVFTSPLGGPLRNRNARRSWFNKAVREIGEPGLVPHELRHTAASLAVSAGANVKAVQRMLGHASAAMTLDRYADLFDSDLDAVADHLDELSATARRNLADLLRTSGARQAIEPGPDTTTAPGIRGLHGGRYWD